MAWLGGGSAGKCHTPARSRVITSRRSAREAGVVSRFCICNHNQSHNNSEGRSSPCSLAVGPHEIALLSSSVRPKGHSGHHPTTKKKTRVELFFSSENLNALTALHGTALEESNGMKITARETGAHLGHLNKSMFNNLYFRGSQNR